MALPHGTTGSLGPAFASARLVGLAVRPACAHATRRTISNRAEPTLGRLRYHLRRPPPVKPFTCHCSRSGSRTQVRALAQSGWYLNVGSTDTSVPASSLPPIPCRLRQSSMTGYSKGSRGLFVYSRKPASSLALQFHRVSRGDSGQVVTPFVQVGTYPTRNFATLGPRL